MILKNTLSTKSKYLLILLLIPIQVFAEPFTYSCKVKLEKGIGIYEDTSLFNTDWYKESYEYDDLKELLIEIRTNKKYLCTKNNWIMTCYNKFTDKTHGTTDFIEMGIKNLSYRMYRVTRFREDNKNTGDSFQIKGKCKIVSLFR
jgi:hypothetical protein